jgi:dephospho-CoA kinase
LTIGLTGGIAAGKSEALSAFERLGAATISSDAVVHELLDAEPLYGRIAERWGAEVAAEGRVDRARIGEIVFADPAELSWLESQIHPLVGERIASWLASLPAEAEVAVVEVPLLFETGMEAAFDATVCVVAQDSKRAARARDRSMELLEGRSGRQLSQDEKAARATHVIHNDGSLAELQDLIERLMPELVGLARGAA